MMENPTAIKFLRRILVTRADRIGDLVVSTPVFKALRERFPDAFLAGLTLCENREILEGNPFLNDILLYDKRGSERGWWGNLLFAFKLRHLKFDAVIHLHATNRMHWVTWLAGIPLRIGWRRKAGNLLTHSFPDLKREGELHEAEYNFKLLEILDIDKPESLETCFPYSERAERSLRELARHHGLSWDKQWVVLSPSASCPSKRWPPERFALLANSLAKDRDPVFIVIGTRQDRGIVGQMKSSLEVPVVDLTGKLSLGMLGVLLKKASLLVSNDSGPVHIASAFKTPVVSIFGRKQPGLSPKRWRPLGDRVRTIWKDVGCEECLAHKCQINFLCLDVISVDEVLDAVKQLMPKREAVAGGGLK